MMGVVEDRIAEMHRINDGEDEPPAPVVQPDAPPAAPDAAIAAAPVVAPEPRVLSYDDLLPEDDSIPQSFRKRPVRELIEDRRKTIQQRDEFGAARNENEVMKQLIPLLLEKATTPAPQPSEPARAETPEERIRRENLDAIVGADPSLVLGRTVEIARELIQPDLKAQIDPVSQRVEKLERAAEAKTINDAYDTAGRILKRTPEQWRSATEIQAVSRVVELLGLPGNDSKSYVQASEFLDGLAAVRAPKPAAAVAPSAPPPVAPPPPVGTGAAAAPNDQPTPQLDVRTSNIVDRVAKHFRAQGFELPSDKLNAAAMAAMNTNRERRSSR